MKRISIFCGSSRGNDPEYSAAAAAMGRELVRRDIELVFGGGKVGLMGIIADTVLRAGGRATGVIPKGLVAREVGHDGLSELHIVGTMHERKALMARLSDGFIAMPGGIGTFEELFEIWTWAQLGMHRKPIGVLNVGGYYDPMIAMVEEAVRAEFLKPVTRQMLMVDSVPERLLDRFETWQPPDVMHWIDEETS
jgi:uncharacterized protein (TIGR00730 family)